METVKMDETGKIYFPKSIREKTKFKFFNAIVLPDGDVILHRKEKKKSPKEALRAFQTLPKTKKPISQIKREIEENFDKI